MAAPAGSGYGISLEEDVTTVDVGETKRDGPKVISGEVGRGVAVGDLNGSEVCAEEGAFGGGGEVEKEEEQVAKKPRVEKAENGGAEKKDDGLGGESEVLKEGEVENGAGEETEKAVEETGEKEGEKEGGKEGAETGEDAAPGDAGLRSLLHEGEIKKASVVSHAADATHTVNGAK